MKKALFLLFVFNSIFCYSQTWTIRVPEEKCDYERTVITREQFERLKRINEERYRYCIVEYYDALEINNSSRVISGTRPNFTGYYYFQQINKPHNDMADSDKQILSLRASTLFYGNANTGRLILTYGNSPLMIDYFGAIYLGKEASPFFGGDSGWNRYIRRYNQFLSYVNGE